MLDSRKHELGSIHTYEGLANWLSNRDVIPTKLRVLVVGNSEEVRTRDLLSILEAIESDLGIPRPKKAKNYVDIHTRVRAAIQKDVLVTAGKAIGLRRAGNSARFRLIHHTQIE